MDETDHIVFVALEPGLGLQEPQVLSEAPLQAIKVPPVIQKLKPRVYPIPVDQAYRLVKLLRWGLAFLVDHIFIGGIYLLLLGIFFVQTDYHGDAALSSKAILLGHGILFIILYGFYFLFFKQFKTPTLGKWVVFGDQED